MNDLAKRQDLLPAEEMLAETRESESTAMLRVIERAASSPDVDVEKMERLLQMHERISARKAEAMFNVAMSAAQAEMGPISADATNPTTRSKYASYAKLDKRCRPIYTHYGFALSFDTGDQPATEYVRVVCYVSHKDGHSKTYHADMPADGKGAKGGDVMTKTHAAGSAMSYGMRYLLKLIFNVAVGEEDDDGNAASTETITEAQVADLEALIEEVQANRAAFLKYCKVDKLADIPATSFKTCVRMLEAKRKRAAE